MEIGAPPLDNPLPLFIERAECLEPVLLFLYFEASRMIGDSSISARFYSLVRVVLIAGRWEPAPPGFWM